MPEIVINDEMIKRGAIARMKELLPRRDAIIDDLNRLKIISNDDDYDVQRYQDEKLRLDGAIMRIEAEIQEQGRTMGVQSIGTLYAIVKAMEQNDVTEEFNPGRT